VSLHEWRISIHKVNDTDQSRHQEPSQELPVAYAPPKMTEREAPPVDNAELDIPAPVPSSFSDEWIKKEKGILSQFLSL